MNEREEGKKGGGKRPHKGNLLPVSSFLFPLDVLPFLPSYRPIAARDRITE